MWQKVVFLIKICKSIYQRVDFKYYHSFTSYTDFKMKFKLFDVYFVYNFFQTKSDIRNGFEMQF